MQEILYAIFFYENIFKVRMRQGGTLWAQLLKIFCFANFKPFLAFLGDFLKKKNGNQRKTILGTDCPYQIFIDSTTLKECYFSKDFITLYGDDHSSSVLLFR